jgi:DnaJ-class molecular chaperone
MKVREREKKTKICPTCQGCGIETLVYAEGRTEDWECFTCGGAGTVDAKRKAKDIRVGGRDPRILGAK